MRCTSCNKNLNDSESTRRVASTGEFLDMCNKCYADIAQDVPTISRSDLNPFESIEDELVQDELTWDEIKSWGDE
jgi:hypothetical protein